jgi:preprotein translocase subunit SecG
MGVLTVFLLVLFVITCVLLVLLVLVQSSDGDNLGGVFAGGGSSAFGSRSGNILTRASSILGGVFLVLSLALALVNRTPGVSGVEAAGRETIQSNSSDWWEPTSTAPDAPAAAETTVPAETAAPVETAPAEGASAPAETPAAPQ